ncbi:phytoene desaturase family protein [Halapricum desulfuricans]|uniref:Phytoene dehydrogenase or related enzyme n=1 Tax=Halapricum desulfuricans TaxID=2841257 RepID=A0A897NNL6_9EURY|nr:phytoene desaturase family protein [Halapricum desulfuricans]QSG13851.1 Phytoene dehydrogenase or related enzyme [Halapricum desulfuricans]
MQSLSDQQVVVVGGGIGGLSTACYLADAGADVTLLEKNGQLGGRASRLEREGFVFDMGPSWYLMPDVFERFFGHFDRTPEEFYELERLDPHYRIFFKDGEASDDGAETGRRSDKVDISPNRAENRELFESIEPGAGEAFDSYLSTSETHYETAMEKFVYEDRSRLRDWIDPDVMRAAPIGLQLIGSMQSHVSDYFQHPRLQQIMQYTLVFLGGSPKNTPALYNMMSHVDFNLGVYYPVPKNGDGPGGVGVVVDAIVDLAEQLGVTFETNSEVGEITRRKDAFHVETVDGDVYRPDRVVVNADYRHAEQELMPEHERQYDESYWADRTYAPSAFLMYLGVEGDVEELAHHTLVLPEDWDPHFDQIFERPAWPDDPAYYLCVPSKTDEAVAPEGHSNLFVLVPIAPGLRDTDALRERYREQILEDVATNTGVDLRDRIVVEETFAVDDFVDRYNATEGTALGLAHTLRQTALLRPNNRSSAVDGLYFTGSFTTPGIGVPMTLISGQHAAEALVDDL